MKDKLSLTLKNLNIDTHKDPVIYMRKNCYVCLSEGFEAKARLHIKLGNKSIIATLNIVSSDILELNQVSLSKYAWDYLGAKEGDEIIVTHAKHLYSLKFLRSKMYGNTLNYQQIKKITQDIAHGSYSDVHIAAFLASCTGKSRMNKDEIIYLTKAMGEVGDKLSWDSYIVVDKHCIGGLHGNSTTPIIVAIVAAFGLKIPKTSSRAITSASGTADTMEVLTNVKVSLPNIKKIVAKENGCMVWGGAISLSPADDIMIRVERSLEIDSEGQLVASILSKKIASGATHILIDIPVGPTAKIRSKKAAATLKNYLEDIGEALGVKVKVIISDGTQPVGIGIGPTLEARDLLAVLKNEPNAPDDLRQHSLVLAGNILEFSNEVKVGEGLVIAKEILESGKAWKKFQSICKMQGGLKEIPKAKFKEDYLSPQDGTIKAIDNRQLSLIARLAGAPNDKSAGIDLLVKVGAKVKKGDLLFKIYAESTGTLKYAINTLNEGSSIIKFL
jgi:thymidine phosphorylase